MILRYRVSLPGIKGFARIYEVKDTASLYSFHKQMRADMDFPQDQVVLFKAFDAEGNVAARYSVFTDFGFGTIDHVTAGECHKKGEDKFIEIYELILAFLMSQPENVIRKARISSYISMILLM